MASGSHKARVSVEGQLPSPGMSKPFTASPSLCSLITLCFPSWLKPQTHSKAGGREKKQALPAARFTDVGEKSHTIELYL